MSRNRLAVIYPEDCAPLCIADFPYYQGLSGDCYLDRPQEADMQDLLLRLIGREYYFRALLTRGPFEHLQFHNLEAFFGRSLIDAYRSESTLHGVGLFMDQSVLPDNRIFPTKRHCDRFHYVFLTQHLDRNLDWDEEAFPIPGSLLDDAGLQYYVYPQLMFLRDVWEKTRNHADPRVRSKFQARWTFYEKKLPGLCAVWASSGFNLEAIPDANWESARKKYESELESAYYRFSPDHLARTSKGNRTENDRE